MRRGPAATARPWCRARPPGAALRGSEGTEVSLFAAGLQGPRILRVALNGDVFVAETAGGRVRVLRPATDGRTPAANEVFATGLDAPFGIAFWPPGPAPEWV